MDEENVNDFTQSAIPTTGAPSFSQSIMPGIYGGQEKVAEGMANMYQRREKEEKEKAEKIKKQNAVWNQQLLDMPDVFEQDYQEIKLKVNEYNDFIIAKKSAGEDMDNLSNDDIKKMKELSNQIRRAAIISKDNEEYWKQLQTDIDGDKTGKYDKTHAAKWNADYAKLSLEEKMKYRNTEDPRKLNYGIFDFIDETIPPIDKVTDTGRVKTTQKDPVEHKRIILETIRNTPVGMEQYEALKLPNETEDQFADRVVAEGQIRYKVQKDVQPAPQPRSNDGNKDKEDKNKVVVTGQQKVAGSQWDQAYTANKLSVGNAPPIYAYSNPVIDPATGQVTEESRAIMNFVPQDGFYLKPGGAVTAIGYGIDEDGKQVKVEVDYDANKGNFNAQGYPNMFDAFRGVAEGTFSSPSSSSSIPDAVKASVQNTNPN
jgi:hypothetical protein